MKRKKHWMLFAILLLALINLSPSNKSTLMSSENVREAEAFMPQQRETELEPGIISVAVQLPFDEFNYLQQLNQSVVDDKQFQVELINLPFESDYASILEQLVLGDSPDILLLNNAWVRKFASGGYLLPTENYYPGPLTGEVLSASLLQNEWNGYAWAVPMDTDPYVWVYNESYLMDHEGHFPASAREWNKLIQKFLAEKTSQNFIALDYSDPYAVISLMWQLLGQTKYSSETLFQWNEEQQKAVKQLDSLRPYLTDLNESDSEDDVWSQLHSGDTAFALVKWSDAKQHQLTGVQVWFPDAESSSGGMWVSGRSFAITASARNPEAAGLWIAEMTSQQRQRQWFDETGHLPVLNTLYDQAVRNGLPSWIPASYVNGKGPQPPVGAGIPSSMEQYGKLSADFLNEEISFKSYIDQLNKI